MKRTMPKTKLVLSKETLRRLNGVDLARVGGATTVVIVIGETGLPGGIRGLPGDHQIPLPGASGFCTNKGCSLQVGNCIPNSIAEVACAAQSMLVSC